MTEQLSSPAPMTADELLYLHVPDKQAELVLAVLVLREPPGYQHGVVAFRIAARIGEHVRANQLGEVFAAETGFRLFFRS